MNSRISNTTRALLLGLVLMLALAACGGQSEEEVLDELRATLVSEVGVDPEQADCIVDRSWEAHSLDELETLAEDTPDPAVAASVQSITVDCLINAGEGLSSILGDDEDAADDEEYIDGPTEEDTTDGLTEDDYVDGPTEQPTATPVPVPTEAPEPTAVPTPAPEPTAVPDVVDASLDAFCVSSWDVAEAVSAGDYFVDALGAYQVQAWANEVDVRADTAIAAAPTPELAGPPVAFEFAWTQLRESFPTSGTFADFGNGPDDATHIQTVASIVEQLEGFLMSECGVAADELEGNAEGLAIQFSTLENPDAGDRVESIDILDETTGIWTEAPAYWTDLDAFVGDSRILTIGTDVVAYDETWAVEGARIIATDVDPGTANAAAAAATSPAFSECDVIDTEGYNDGVYSGLKTTFENCGAGGISAVVVAASTEEQDVEVIVEIQVPTGSEGLFNIVLDSFVV